MTQNRRQEAITGFRSGKYDVLVATDIAARGIDVSEISHVINYDMPDTVDAYTHRIGRTGRAEQTGEAFTFTSPADELMVRDIERLLGTRIERRRVDNFDYGATTAAHSASQRSRQYDRQSSGSNSRGGHNASHNAVSGYVGRTQAAHGSYASSSHSSSAGTAASQRSSAQHPAQPPAQAEQHNARPNSGPAGQLQRRRRFIRQGRSTS